MFKRRISALNNAVRVVIAGGVTGGHLFPGIVLAEEFMSRNINSRILFISIGNALERSVLSESGFQLQTIGVRGIKGKGIFNLITSVLSLPKGVLEAVGHLIRFKPDLVISVGGFPAGPVAVGAWLMGIRRVLCEQNMIPGITNRILSRISNRIYLSFKSSGEGFSSKKKKVLGNPVRRGLFRDQNGLIDTQNKGNNNDKTFNILIIGGSQGAHTVNLSIMDALGRLKQKEKYLFMHQTGANDEETVKRAYDAHGIKADVRAFFKDMAYPYQKADLVICRAGATTVAEVSAMGKAAIFIPFPYAADDHQVYNARALVDDGAAEMILEQDLNGEMLAKKIEDYVLHPDALHRMAANAGEIGKPEAGKQIVDDCYQLLMGASPEQSSEL